MGLNPKDKDISTEELQLQAAHCDSEERIIEILSEIIVRTISAWKEPGWFTHWASTTPKREAEEFLQHTINQLLELELFEYCKDVELMKGQLELFHSMKKTKNS